MALDMKLDVVQLLNANALTKIRRQYTALQQQGVGLSLIQFVAVLSPFVPSNIDEIQRLKDLSELFRRIDTDGSGTVEWAEFTSYCVESGVAATSSAASVQVARRETFLEVPMKNMSDAAQLSATIACLKFVPDLQQVFVCERGSLAIKIYNQQMQLMAMLFVRMPAREGAMGSGFSLSSASRTKSLKLDDAARAELRLAATREGKRKVEKRLLRTQNLHWASETLALPPTPAAYGPLAVARQQAARFMGDENGRKLLRVVNKRKRKEGDTSVRAIEMPDSADVSAALGASARNHERRMPSAGMCPGARISKSLWNAGDPALVNPEVVCSLDLPYSTQASGLNEAATVRGLESKVAAYKLRRGGMTRAQQLASQTLEEQRRTRPFGTHAEEVKSEKLKNLTWSLMGRPSMEQTSKATKRAHDTLVYIGQTRKLAESQEQRRAILEQGRRTRTPREANSNTGRPNSASINLMDDVAYPKSSEPDRVIGKNSQKHFFDPETRGRVALLGSLREGDSESASSNFESSTDGEGVTCIEYCTPRPYTESTKEWRELKAKEPAHIIAVTNGDMTLTFWDTKRFTYCGHAHMLEPTERMVWSPSANALFTSHSESQIVQVWDVLGRTLLAELRNHREPIQAIVNVPTYGLFATGSMDCSVHLYSCSDEGTPCKPVLDSSFRKHFHGVRSLVAVSGGGLILSGGGVDGYYLWDALAKVVLLNIPSGKHRFLDIKVLSGAHKDVAVTLDDTGLFRMWHLSDFTAPAALCIGIFRSRAPEFDVRLFDVISPELSIVASGRAHHFLQHKELQHVDPFPVQVQLSLQLGILVIMTGNDFSIFSAETGNLIRNVHDAAPDLIVSSSFDESQRKLVLGDASGNLFEYNAQTGSKLKEADEAHLDDVVGICFSMGDQVLVSGSWDRSLRVFDDSLSSSMPCLRIAYNAHDCDITSVAYNRNCGKVISGGSDGKLRLWDFGELAHEATALGDGSTVSCSAFVSPQDELPILVVGTSGGTLDLYHVPQAARGWRLQLSCDNVSSKAQSKNVHNIATEVPDLPTTHHNSEMVSVPIMALDTFVTGLCATRQAAARHASPLPNLTSRMFRGFPSSSSALAEELEKEFAEVDKGLRASAWVVTGDGQGRLQCWDLTDAFLRWDVSPIPPASTPQAKPSCNPRHKRRRGFPRGTHAAYDPSLDAMQLRTEQAAAWGTDLDPVVKLKPIKQGLTQAGPKASKPNVVKDTLKEDMLMFPQAIAQLTSAHPAWYSHMLGQRNDGFATISPSGQVNERLWRTSRKDPRIMPQISWVAHSGPILSVKIVPSRPMPSIVSSSQDLSVRIWSLVGLPLAVVVAPTFTLPRGISTSGVDGLSPLSAEEVGWKFKLDLTQQIAEREEEARKLQELLRRPPSRRSSMLGQVHQPSGVQDQQGGNYEAQYKAPERPGLSLPSVLDAVNEAEMYRKARQVQDTRRQRNEETDLHLVAQQASLSSAGSIRMHMVDINLDNSGGDFTATQAQLLPTVDLGAVDKVLHKATQKRRELLKKSEAEDAAATKTDDAMVAGQASQHALQDLEQGSSATNIPIDQVVAFEVGKHERKLERQKHQEAEMVGSMRGLKSSSHAELEAAEHTMRDNAPMPKALVGKYANFSKHAVSQARKLRQQQRLQGGSDEAVQEVMNTLGAMCATSTTQRGEQNRRPLKIPTRPQSAAPRSHIVPKSGRPASASARSGTVAGAERPILFAGARRSSYQTPAKTSFEARFKAPELHAVEQRKIQSEKVEARVRALLRKSKAAFCEDVKVMQRGVTAADADFGLQELPANSIDELSTRSTLDGLSGGTDFAGIFPDHQVHALRKRRQRLVESLADTQASEERETGPDKLAQLLRTVQRRQSLPLHELLYEEPPVKPTVHQSPMHASRATAERTRPPGKDIPMWFGPYSRENVRALKEMFEEIDVDGSGAVDIEEFMTSEMFQGLLPTVAKSLFRAVDVDGSKELELDELLQVAFPNVDVMIIKDMLRYCNYLTARRSKATSRAARRLEQLGEAIDERESMLDRRALK